MSINQIKDYSQYLSGNIDFTNHKIEVLDILVKLSCLYGKPLYFNSSFRTPIENQLCGGSPTSSHLKGLAFDIKCITSTDRYKLIDAINTLCINRYGVYKNFIHIDFDIDKPQNVTWYG